MGCGEGKICIIRLPGPGSCDPCGDPCGGGWRPPPPKEGPGECPGSGEWKGPGECMGSGEWKGPGKCQGGGEWKGPGECPGCGDRISMKRAAQHACAAPHAQSSGRPVQSPLQS